MITSRLLKELRIHVLPHPIIVCSKRNFPPNASMQLTLVNVGSKAIAGIRGKSLNTIIRIVALGL